MEVQMLEASISFNELLSDFLGVVDEQWIAQEGRFRPGGRINVYDLGDDVWLQHFRFTREEVHQLVDALDLPEVVHCPESRNREDRVTALCMLLCRLTHASRLSDIEMQFGWERSRFSRITRLTASIIWDRWKHLLRFDPTRLTRQKLAEFGAVVQRNGAPLDVIVAMIDGTLRKNARPVRNQRILYNGWKRMHCLKYHAILAPDGIVIHVYGPVEGRRHDETVFQQSGVMEILDKHFWTPDNRPLFIYGDPAYNVSAHVLAPYKGAAVTAEQSLFNSAMSHCRETVEWAFKEVSQQFPFIDFSRNQKVLLSPCGLYYLIAILLGNAHTILHKPQISQYFRCNPPTLAEYFTGGPDGEDDIDSDSGLIGARQCGE